MQKTGLSSKQDARDLEERTGRQCKGPGHQEWGRTVWL